MTLTEVVNLNSAVEANENCKLDCQSQLSVPLVKNHIENSQVALLEVIILHYNMLNN